MHRGRVLQINVSSGGVPKRPVPEARVTRLGIAGDRQRAVTVHGGPHRAVSLLGIEAIRRVAAEGHPIGPGTTGENLTVEGFDVSTLPVGTRLAVGDELVLEVSGHANPCRTIRHSFRDLGFGRLGASNHPRDGRMYARVVREGVVRPGDRITTSPPPDDAAARFTIADRLGHAERASAMAVWRAAAETNARITILDDGEVAVAAAPDLPGPIFNSAYGFAHLPNLVDMAIDHFRAHRTTGWIWTDEEPWPDAVADSTALLVGASLSDPLPSAPVPEGFAIRELPRDEVGAWADVSGAAAELPPPVAAAWRALERPLALAAHQHRFVAERDGRVVATGALFTHRRVGWLRSASVLPEARGRGLQRALIRARMERARALGCELVGSLADAGGTSAANLARLGLDRLAIRRRYRVAADASAA